MLLEGFFAGELVEGQRWRTEEKILSGMQVFPVDGNYIQVYELQLATHKHLNCELNIVLV